MDGQAQTADRGPGSVQIRAGDGSQVEELALAGAALAAGQGEQCLDEVFLLGVGGEQFPADGLPGACGARRVGECDLKQGAFPGQRRAQFVRGVGGEATLGVERCLQPREQAVKGVGEFLELVVGSVQGQPFVQAAGGDPPGGSGDRAQRAQHPAGDEPADRGGGDRDDRQGDGGGDQQLPLVVVDLSLGLAHQFSPLSRRDDRRCFVKRFVELAEDGDGDVDYVVATCLLDGGAGDCHFGGWDA